MTAATDPVFAGLARQAELIAAGELSSRELTEAHLERIARLDPTLNAFRVVFAERALAEAAQADGRRGSGDRRPLLGVPVAIKDDTDVAGEVTARGSNAFGDPAAQDAEVVRRLRAAGAVIVGKTSVPELEITPFTETPTFGATRNPWDLNRTPGGSSGGSAAAVAAGLAGGALGSDGGGSIRIPAGCCGLFGLKTQRGRISFAPKDGAWHGLSVYGPIVRRVADAALFIDATSDGEPLAPAVTRGARAACGSRSRPSSPRASSARRTRSSAGRSTPPWSCCAGSGTRSSSAIPTTGRAGRRGPRATSAGSTTRGARWRTRSGCRGAPAASCASGPRSRRRSSSGRVADGAAAAQRIGRLFEHADVLLTPMFTRRPIPIGTYEGRGALWSFNGYARWVPYCAAVQPHRPARRLGADRLHARRLPARRPARRPPGRRGDAALARRADRAGAPVGRPGPGGLDVNELLALAERIAREAGAQLREAFAGAAVDIQTKSSPTDLVSAADVAAEKLIREALLSARPDDGMLGEEGSDTPGTSGLRWIVDPLDGTTNFLFGIPQWCVSIAVEDASGTLAGVVFDPMRDECWAAVRGEPPTLNGEPLRRPERSGGLATALVATGFGYDADVRAAQAAGVTRLLPRVRDIRRARLVLRSTSRGPPRGATTRTTSAGSSCGTSPPAS